ncbi:hypothetical protein CU102_22100 [Phyllobacterium brassicacearum]|uniref:Response regulatory domain-containing protein n=1 Tax=Phyllobacterium brassicacearum TaxID=314235 RepID=A0A2P7BD30_9HYPH|nr:hypothetical protein [Phyllobacterium brassicacearum]PSH64378.1 hypothetical protein CU102_22100 [Phyllobacterium brassicacearum]TDQ21304.1 CheY-like chemotaxis protein [Phyllobacterium brassicacearum]
MELTGMRLLVLEDEYLIGLELERIAEECGTKSVHLVTTIDELLFWIGSGAECDIAILEVQAHGKSSLQAASYLLQRGTPVIFSTAYDQQRDGVDGFPDTPVVVKPYGKCQIVKAVTSVLGSRQADEPSCKLV